MRIENEVKESKFFAVLKDPFYYAMATPRLWMLLVASFMFIMAVAAVMIGLWTLIKRIAEGKTPSPENQPFRMFVAAACVSCFTIIAGIIHRRMTAAEVRGKFVTFSKSVYLRNHAFEFSLIDQRKTQLIGTSISLSIVLLSDAHGVDPSAAIEARRIELGSPGIIAIPAVVSIPVDRVFPSMEISSCEVCGRSNFRSTEALMSHLSFIHQIKREVSEEEFRLKLATEISKIEIFRITLTGVDEVSGKGGVATREYIPSEIGVEPNGPHEETFSVISGKDLEVMTPVNSSSDDDEVSTVQGSKTSQDTYVHVDFHYK
jgi:hypothetical protein